MPCFSKKSAERLAQCHPDLQAVMNEAIKEFDFTVLCGQRNEADQYAAFVAGFTKVKYPNSKHNKAPSLAVDVAPYPIDWNNIERFKALAKHIHTTAHKLGIVLRHGADWNMNGDFTDEKFIDWPHWEVV